MANYQKKLQNLKNRRQDTLTKAFSLNESFNRKSYGESTTYALEAMEPISDTYTQNTYKACERIINQLTPGLKEYGIDVEFRYQGSVATNTHIKLYSDIDLLTIHGAFFTLERPQVPTSPYLGDPLADLKNLRAKTHRILDTIFPACDLDDTGSKCLTICGGSIGRKVDIIASNWYNALIYRDNKNEANRGVQILDRDKDDRITNFPFLHIYWINFKDALVNGNEKRMIRLMKSLKVDADEEIKVSSYDIASLIFRMDDQLLRASSMNRLVLLKNTNDFLLKVVNDSSFRDTLYVANRTRKIFCDDGCKVAEVSKLQKELDGLMVDIATELRPFRNTIENATINY